MRDTIEKLRATLPPLLTIAQYCHTMNRCAASAYNDFKKHPGLAVKNGGSTRVVRDVMLDEVMAHLQMWVPERDRDPAEKVSAPRRFGWPRSGLDALGAATKRRL